MTLRKLVLILFAVILVAPSRARAQDEFGDDDDSSASSPHKHHHHHDSDDSDEQLEDEPDPSARNMARIDDPRVGLGAELTLSLALLDGTGGKASFGVRANWSPGFLWTEPENAFWREALLLELSYDYTAYSNGTAAVNTSTHLHYLNMHVMFGYPVRDVLLFYGLFGPGMTVEGVNYAVQNAQTPLSGIKANLAAGGGARINLQVNKYFAFVSRFEYVHYFRGYLDDDFLTFSLGGAF
jgi:hypothetical protein